MRLQGLNRIGLDPKRRKNVVSAELPPARLPVDFRFERSLAFPSRELLRSNLSFPIWIIRLLVFWFVWLRLQSGPGLLQRCVPHVSIGVLL